MAQYRSAVDAAIAALVASLNNLKSADASLDQAIASEQAATQSLAAAQAATSQAHVVRGNADAEAEVSRLVLNRLLAEAGIDEREPTAEVLGLSLGSPTEKE